MARRFGTDATRLWCFPRSFRDLFSRNGEDGEDGENESSDNVGETVLLPLDEASKDCTRLIGMGNDLLGEYGGIRGTFKVSSPGEASCDLCSRVTIGMGTDAES